MVVENLLLLEDAVSFLFSSDVAVCECTPQLNWTYILVRLISLSWVERMVKAVSKLMV
jgi:hypothetical protein